MFSITGARDIYDISILLRWIAIEVLLYLVYDCVALVLIPFFTGKTCKPINKK